MDSKPKQSDDEASEDGKGEKSGKGSSAKEIVIEIPDKETQVTGEEKNRFKPIQ